MSAVPLPPAVSSSRLPLPSRSVSTVPSETVSQNGSRSLLHAPGANGGQRRTPRGGRLAIVGALSAAVLMMTAACSSSSTPANSSSSAPAIATTGSSSAVSSATGTSTSGSATASVAPSAGGSATGSSVAGSSASAATGSAGTAAGTTSASSTAAAAGSTLPPPATTVVPPPSSGNINQTVPANTRTVETTAPLTKPVVADKVSIQVTSHKKFTFSSGGQAGDLSGPAITFTLRMTNSTGAVLDLTNVSVTMQDAAGNPGTPLSGADSVGFSGSVKVGGSATGSYSFSLPKTNKDPIQVRVSYSAAAPTAIFIGSAT